MVRILNIEEDARSRKIPVILDGGMEFILEYIKKNNIKSILEIGSAIGYSAIRFASVNSDINVTTIERNKELYKEAVKNIKEFELEERINIILGDALETEITGKYDLIFIDAAKSQYIRFFEKYKVNLADNGSIITDNLSFHGLVDNPTLTKNRNTKQLVGKISKYIEFLKNNTEFKTEFYSCGDGISVSKRIVNNEWLFFLY